MFWPVVCSRPPRGKLLNRTSSVHVPMLVCIADTNSPIHPVWSWCSAEGHTKNRFLSQKPARIGMITARQALKIENSQFCPQKKTRIPHSLFSKKKKGQKGSQKFLRQTYFVYGLIMIALKYCVIAMLSYQFILLLFKTYHIHHMHPMKRLINHRDQIHDKNKNRNDRINI